MKLLWIAILALALAVGGCAHNSSSVAAKPSVFDNSGGTPGERSANLDDDIRLMWGVGPREQGRNWVTSTPEAVKAANRAFNTIDLTSMTEAEMSTALKFDLRAKDYGYNAPYWPAAPGDTTIRIDTGLYGWQFDVHFDKHRKVTGVTRRWIH